MILAQKIPFLSRIVHQANQGDESGGSICTKYDRKSSSYARVVNGEPG
jgi:hypothetical protein